MHFLFWLVISMVSMFSTVSSLASKHICSFAHCPYHTRMANTVICYHNTHHPHHFKPQMYVLLTLFLCLGGGEPKHKNKVSNTYICEPTTTTLRSSGTMVCSSTSLEDNEGGPAHPLVVLFVILTTKYNNIIFRKV